MKLQGFELEIEGSREDVPLISQNIADQLTGFLKPAAAILDGEVVSTNTVQASLSPAGNSSGPKRRVKRPTSVGKSETSASNGAVIDWRHDSEKYAMPSQTWTVSDKYLWVLYVIGEELNQIEVPAINLANSFNKHFKQFGSLIVNNAKRDMGTLKKKKPALVGEDTTKSPTTWFLTEAGKKTAQQLIINSLNPQK